MIDSLDKAILNIGMSRNNKYGDVAKNDILYSRWDKRFALTLGDFYGDFIEPRLPHADVVRRWNDILLEYATMKDAVFPIRDGHSDNKDNDKLKLRRGWLVKVDAHLDYEDRFSYMFTDNHLAAYIYKMALDGYCPATAKEFYDFMTEFKYPSDINWLQGKKVKNDSYNEQKRKFISMPVHFGWIGKSSYPGQTESEKNAYINTTPAPTCPFGAYSYKHAHILGVKNGSYRINGQDMKWDDVTTAELGEENRTQQDYQWDDTIKNFAWHRKMNDEEERNALRKLVVAHFLRFLNPMNHFLAPMQGCNKFTKENKEYSLDIAEYEQLISHLIFVREKEFGADFAKFQKEALMPGSLSPKDCGADLIEIIYHEKKQDVANQKNTTDLAAEKAAAVKTTATKTTTTSTASKTASSRKSLDVTYQMAAYYLRNTDRMSVVGTKFLPTPDRNGSKTKSRFNRIGILGEHKGLLISISIDDAIKDATGLLKETLEEIKRRGL